MDRLHYNPQLVIPSTFEECLTYEMQIMYLYRYIDEVATGTPSEVIDDIYDKIDKLATSVTNLQTEVGAIDISGINDEIADIKTRIDTLVANDTRHDTAIDGLTTDVASMGTELAGIKTTVDNHTESLSTINTTLSTHQDDLDDLDASVEELKTSVGANTTAIESLRTTVAATNTRVDTLTTQVEDAVETVGAMDTKVDEAVTDITTNTADVTKLKTDVAGNKTEIAAVKTSVAGKQDKLTFDSTPTANSQNPVTSDGIAKAIAAATPPELTIDNTVTEESAHAVKSSGIWTYGEGIKSGLQTQITANKTAIDDVTDEIAPIKESITSLTETVESDGEQIAALQDNVGGLMSDVADNTADVTKLKTDVAGNKTEIAAVKTSVAGKQDKLTFDSTPTTNSQNPVTSDGIAKAIAAATPPSIVLDDTVTEDSAHAVKSSGIWTYGEGIKSVLQTQIAANKTAIDDATEAIANAESDIGVNSTEIGALKKSVAGKQDKLTFDATPTINSQNPVTSDGIAKAIAAATPAPPELTIDDTVTEDSANAVKSSGIWTYGESIKSGLQTQITANKTSITSVTTEVGALDDRLTTAEDTLTDLATEVGTNTSAIGGINTDLQSVRTQLDGKQSKLTFDTTPTVDSDNPVTSDGIAKAINALPAPPKLYEIGGTVGSYGLEKLGGYTSRSGMTVAMVKPFRAYFPPLTSSWRYACVLPLHIEVAYDNVPYAGNVNVLFDMEQLSSGIILGYCRGDVVGLKPVTGTSKDTIGVVVNIQATLTLVDKTRAINDTDMYIMEVR